MANSVKTDTDSRFDDILLDSQRELNELRGEIDKYQIVFDSARLIVGHEFIKPLTSISGYVELLEQNLGDAINGGSRQYFLKIREAIERLDALVEAFVQMLRFDSRVEQLHDLEHTNIKSLVEKVRERFEDKAGRIENAVSDDIPDLYVRRTSIEVVLENLISNAIENSTGSSPIKVAATLQRERRGTARRHLLMVNVEDHGVGIPEHEIKDVFNPFYRAGGKRNARGLGLGLALVKSIITIMKGEIHIKSKPGEGTTVTFSVPIPDDLQTLPEKIG